MENDETKKESKLLTNRGGIASKYREEGNVIVNYTMLRNSLKINQIGS